MTPDHTTILRAFGAGGPVTRASLAGLTPRWRDLLGDLMFEYVEAHGTGCYVLTAAGRRLLAATAA